MAEQWLIDVQVAVLSTQIPLVSEKRVGNGSSKLTGNLCPECGMILAKEEGCQKCYSCGFSEC
jgi:hypothetical protein